VLTQTEADTLLGIPKMFVDSSPLLLPVGADEHRDVVSQDGRESFVFDASRGAFRITKVKFQTRARRIFVLARLDLDGSPRTNPDGTVVQTPHLHLYQEGYEAKWAYPLNPTDFQDPDDLGQAYVDFCRFCQLQNTVPLQAGGW